MRSRSRSLLAAFAALHIGAYSSDECIGSASCPARERLLPSAVVRPTVYSGWSNGSTVCNGREMPVAEGGLSFGGSLNRNVKFTVLPAVMTAAEVETARARTLADATQTVAVRHRVCARTRARARALTV